MRHYQSMRIPPFTDKNLRGELRKADQWIRMASTQFGRTVVLPQGSPSGSIGANLGDYLYLPGRANGQISYGRVRFQAKAMPAGGTNVPDTSQTGFGLMSTLDSDGLTSVNFWIEASSVNLPKRPVREWVFPAFNEVEGETAGVHYFADLSDYQSMSFKTFNGCRWVAGTSGGEGWLDATTARLMAWTMENQLTNRNVSTHAQTATRPIVQIPPLDMVLLTPVSSTRDFTHTMCIVKSTLSASSPTATPFEIGGLVFGGDTRQELYSMPGGAKGLYPGPSQSDLIVWNPATAITGDVNFSTTIINIVSTANLRVGMRVRDTRTGQAYVERFITQILTPTQIDTTVAFSENTVGIPFVCHGPTWTAASGLSGIIHSSLAQLVWPADDHTQYLNIFGRVGGQIVAAHGSSPSHSAIDTMDVVVHGTVGSDPDSTNFSMSATGRRAFHASVKPTGPGIQGLVLNAIYDFGSQASGGLSTGIQASMVGAYSGSTSAAVRGFFFLCTANAGTGTMSELTGAQLTVTPANPGGGGITALYGGRFLTNAPTGAMTTNVWGIENLIGPKGMTGTLIHMQCSASSSSTATGAVSDYWGILFGSTGGTTIFDAATVVNWTAIQIPNGPTNPTGTIRGLKIGDILSHHVGPFKFGSTANAVHFVDIAAGTTGIAPLKFTNGTNLTAAIAGCVEYDGSYLQMTHGDAIRTKVVTQRGAVDATAQVAAIGATTVYAAPAAGYFVVHYTLETTTADVAAGTIQLQVNYTDDIGATNQTGAALVLTVTGRDRGAFQVWCNAAQNIQYQTNLTGIIGTSQYALRLRVEALG